MIDKKKYARIRDQIAKARGPLTLFALFLPDEMNDQWDLVVAGPKLRENNFDDLGFVSEIVMKTLSEQDFRSLNRVVVLDDPHGPLQELLTSSVNTSEPIVRDSFLFFRLPIRRGYIFTAQLSSVAA
ncbi:MAG TPA: hypothetical protein VGF69_03340 [Thermoanaerobaculia bacterium]|jgi:hypothetical protein